MQSRNELWEMRTPWNLERICLSKTLHSNKSKICDHNWPRFKWPGRTERKQLHMRYCFGHIFNKLQLSFESFKAPRIGGTSVNDLRLNENFATFQTSGESGESISTLPILISFLPTTWEVWIVSHIEWEQAGQSLESLFAVSRTSRRASLRIFE